VRRRIIIAAIFTVQTVCAFFFVGEILSGVVGFGTQPISWQMRELIEIGAALGLVLGLILGGVELRRSFLARRAAEAQLARASAAFMDLLAQRFEEWALTPAERDDDVHHDAVQLEILGRVDAATPMARRPAASSSGMMPPTTTGMSPGPAARIRSIVSSISGMWLPDRIDRPDHMGAFGRPPPRSRRGQADAFVVDVHAAVAGARGDLFGAVGMAVEARLAHRNFSRRPAGDDRHPPPRGSAPALRSGSTGCATRRWARGTRRNRAHHAPHSPVVAPALAAAIEAGMTLRRCARPARSAASAACTAASSRLARQAFRRAIWSASASGSATMMRPSPAVRGEGSPGQRFTPTTTVSPASIRASRSAFASTSRPFM
jgi:hypothetical protein